MSKPRGLEGIFVTQVNESRVIYANVGEEGALEAKPYCSKH